MPNETAELLVRTVRRYGPDGESVEHTETLNVTIIWPDKPKVNDSYRVTGEWRIADHAT
jgi:hypothetical protein